MIKVWSKEIVETKSYFQGGVTTVKTETRIFTITTEEKKVDVVKEKIGRIVGILRRKGENEAKNP